MNIRYIFFLFFFFISIVTQAQRAKISGVVTDSEGIPIELAIIRASGVANVTFTDEKGKYSFTVATGDSCAMVFY